MKSKFFRSSWGGRRATLRGRQMLRRPKSHFAHPTPLFMSRPPLFNCVEQKEKNVTNKPVPTQAKTGMGQPRFQGRPFSRNLNVDFQGGRRPAFNAALHTASEAMARTKPKVLRERIKADVQFLLQAKDWNSRRAGYNLFNCYSLAIRELRCLFQAQSLSDIIAICTENPPSPLLFGDDGGPYQCDGLQRELRRV